MAWFGQSLSCAAFHSFTDFPGARSCQELDAFKREVVRITTSCNAVIASVMGGIADSNPMQAKPDHETDKSLGYLYAIAVMQRPRIEYSMNYDVCYT